MKNFRTEKNNYRAFCLFISSRNITPQSREFMFSPLVFVWIKGGVSAHILSTNQIWLPSASYCLLEIQWSVNLVSLQQNLNYSKWTISKCKNFYGIEYTFFFKSTLTGSKAWSFPLFFWQFQVSIFTTHYTFAPLVSMLKEALYKHWVSELSWVSLCLTC